MPPTSVIAASASALALDLGSTRFKLGAIDEQGELIHVESIDAPQLSGTGRIREGRPQEFLACATQLLNLAQQRFVNLPLMLVCQRSTFLLWDRVSGEALTPVISWQDRRAADWCRANAKLEPLIAELTGLLLSPHYAGPKLATLLNDDGQLAERVRRGEVLFGNLDAWLGWHWSGGREHRTDVTMAARTAMFDIEHGEWSQTLLDHYEIPAAVLPKVVDCGQAQFELPGGLRWSGSVADQAASVSAVLEAVGDDYLVNLGTGTFVMRLVGQAEHRVPGYLTGPVSSLQGAFAIEGTINGAGPAIDGFGQQATELSKEDAASDAFMIPDKSGYGAPHWRADIGLIMSPAAEQLTLEQQRLICIEGLLFRILEILIGLSGNEAIGRLKISGGLAADPAIAPGLAALTGRPVVRLAEAETTLLGGARMALGLKPQGVAITDEVAPGPCGAYLVEKYRRWQVWRDQVLAG